jgi:hypothetical protein
MECSMRCGKYFVVIKSYLLIADMVNSNLLNSAIVLGVARHSSNF